MNSKTKCFINILQESLKNEYLQVKLTIQNQILPGCKTTNESVPKSAKKNLEIEGASIPLVNPSAVYLN